MNISFVRHPTNITQHSCYPQWIRSPPKTKTVDQPKISKCSSRILSNVLAMHLHFKQESRNIYISLCYLLFIWYSLFRLISTERRSNTSQLQPWHCYGIKGILNEICIVFNQCIIIRRNYFRLIFKRHYLGFNYGASHVLLASHKQLHLGRSESKKRAEVFTSKQTT